MRYVYFASPPVGLVLLGLAILWVADLPIGENLDRLFIMFMGGLMVSLMLIIISILTEVPPTDIPPTDNDDG